MDSAKVTAIYNEGAMVGTSFIDAKGFSVLLEIDGERTLFGTGLRERYLSNNLYEADIETDSITRVVVSHGHPDHWGALPAVLRERDAKLPVYAPASAWGVKKFLGSTGMNFSDVVMDQLECSEVSEWVELSKHLYISAPMKFHDGVGEEIFLVFISRHGPVLISGCCHCGLDHIFEAVKERFGNYPIALIGGLHIAEKKGNLAELYAEYLQNVGCRILYLNHCTGVNGIGKMREVLGLKGVNDFYAGQSVDFPVF